MVCSSPAHAQAIERAWHEALGAESLCDFIPSGNVCREHVASGGVECVLVGPGVADVSPENLVAALRKDDERRCEQNPAGVKRLVVVLALEQLSGSSASRGRSAGADLIASFDELAVTLEVFLRRAGVVAPVELDSPRAQGRGQVPATSTADVGRLVGFAGARGGTGVSTIAALLSAVAARSGIPTALVDCDTRFGNVTGFVGASKKPESDVLNLAGVSVDSHGRVVRTPQATRGHAQGHMPGVPAAFGPPILPEHGDALIECAHDLAQHLRNRFQLSVIDLGSSWGEAMVSVLLECDLTMMVMDQRTSSVPSAARAVGLACRFGAAQARIAYVVNRCGPRCSVTALDASLALDAEQVASVRDGGSAVEGLSSEGLLDELIERRSPLVVDVNELLEHVLDGFGMQLEHNVLEQRDDAKRRRRKRGGGL